MGAARKHGVGRTCLAEFLTGSTSLPRILRSAIQYFAGLDAYQGQRQTVRISVVGSSFQASQGQGHDGGSGTDREAAARATEEHARQDETDSRAEACVDVAEGRAPPRRTALRHAHRGAVGVATEQDRRIDKVIFRLRPRLLE
jgi:hypothetical protein